MDDAALWRVAADVAAGLAFLHESGILHLDIKPENIYRDLGGAWRIGDFGLAVANESRVGESEGAEAGERFPPGRGGAGS